MDTPSAADADRGAGTPGYDVFLSYHREDREAVEQVREFLKARGIRIFTDSELPAGMPWVQLLEGALQQTRAVAVLIGPSGLGSWQQRETSWALDRQSRQTEPPFPVIPVLLPGSRPQESAGFLLLNTWVDLRSGLRDEDNLSLLAAAVRSGASPLLTFRPPAEECPYRGLLAFREGDAPWFYGRREQTEQLFRAVKDRNLLAVVAPSGSGKSSLVQAGLTPMLRREKPPQTCWEIAIARPGDRPWRRLADALVPLLEPDSPQSAQLERGESYEKAMRSGGLPECVDRALQASGGADRLLLVLDQFEELFTLTPAAERAPFLDELMQCTKSARLTLVLVVRGDFYGQAIASHRALSDALDSRVINLAPMRTAELRDAIEKPAQPAGLTFEAGLVDKILDDVESEPGNLPLLQFALTQLWAERRGTLLTHEGYEKNGKVIGAIAHRAEEFWRGLDDGQQKTVQRLFTRFVRLSRPGEDSGDTRRRVLRSELSDEEWEIVQKLAEKRLLVTDRLEREETVEVAHEALIRHWDRLRKWLNSDREFFLWRQRLDAVVTQWKAAGQKEGDLPRGHLLEEAENWRENRRELLSTEEESAIAAAVVVRVREQRNAARLRILLLTLPLLGVGLAVAVGAGFRQNAVASSRELAASARQYLDPGNTDHSLPLFLALQALRMADTREAREALHQAVQVVGKPAIEGTGAVTAIAFAGGGKLFGVGWEDGSLQLRWGVGAEPVLASMQHGGRIAALAFAPGNFTVVTVGGRNAKLFDVATGAERRTFQHECADVVAAVFVQGGARMVTGCNDGSLTLWNVNDGKALSRLPMGTSIRGMAADPKAERFAVALEDKTVRLLDSAEAREIRRFKGSLDMVAAVAFRADGRQLAGGTNDGEAIVWDVESGSVLMRRRAGPTALSSLAWSPDGRYLLAGTLAGRGIVWAASGMQEEITLEGPQEKPASAVPVAFDPSARDAEPRLTLAGSAGVRIFELGIGRLRQRARALLTRRFTDADCVQYVRRRGCELNP